MLVLFEFIPTSSIISWVREKVGYNQEAQGENTAQGIKDDSLEGDTLMIAGALTLLLTLLVLVISKCTCLIARNYTVFKIYMQIRQRLFYNSIIRYFYTGAIKLQFKSADIFLAGFTLTISCVS